MNTLKATALVLSILVIPGFFSGCTRTSVGTEERPYGQSYVRETPEEESRTYQEKQTKGPGGEQYETKEHVRETGQSARDFNPLNQPKKGETYTKEEIRKEHKTKQGGRT